MKEMLEKIANLEHEQWMLWAKSILDEPISQERRERWEKLFVPYDELTEGMKELDRKWARKVLDELKEEMEAFRFKKEELDRRELNLLDREKALVVREAGLRRMFTNIENDILKHIREIRDTPMNWVNLNREVPLEVCDKHIGCVVLVDGKCPLCERDKK